MKFLARNLSLCGTVCLLLAEVMGAASTMFAGVPTLDDNQSQNYLQLSGNLIYPCRKILYFPLQPFFCKTKVNNKLCTFSTRFKM